MTKKSEEIAARRLALGLSVVSNDSAPAANQHTKPASSGSGFSRNRTSNSKPAEPVILDTSLAGNFHNQGSAPPGTGRESKKDLPRIGVVQARAGVPSESDYPGSKPNLVCVDGKTGALDHAAATYAKWLEEQYHANAAPFAFLGEVPLQLIDMPEPAVVELAIKMLKAGGWQVGGLIEFQASGTRAGSIVLMHPTSVGF